MHKHHDAEDFAAGFIVGQSSNSGKPPSQSSPVALMMILGIVIGLVDFIIVPALWSGSIDMLKYNAVMALFCFLFTFILFAAPLLMLSLSIYWIVEARRRGG